MKRITDWAALILGALLFLGGTISAAGWWWSLPLLSKASTLLLLAAFAHFGAGAAYSRAVGWYHSWSEKQKPLICHAQRLFFLSAVFGLPVSVLGSVLGVCSPLTMDLAVCYIGAMAMAFGARMLRMAARFKPAM